MGCLPDLNLISPGAPLAAHVFCVDCRDNRYPLVTAHLGGPDAAGPPFGWHWHPSLAATSPTRLRDGDVLVVDPTAERVWDPLAGVPPTIALDKLAISASLLGTGRPFAGVLVLVGLPVALAQSQSFLSVSELADTGDMPFDPRHTHQAALSTDVSLGGCSQLAYGRRGHVLRDLKLHEPTDAKITWISWVARVCLLATTRGRSTGYLGLFFLLASRPSLGVRLDSAGFAHRLWQPGGGLQDPVWSHDIRCPQELAMQYPAWDHPVQVRPAVYGGGWEWIPGSVDPTLVSVVAVAPPMPRAALLPRVCTARILLNSLQLQTPSLTDVEATPAAWRGTRKQAVPTLYLRDGDVLQFRNRGWTPMLRAPPAILHCSPAQAARDAFWGLPFRIRDPGMIIRVATP